jgi:hypothetical protein
MDIIFGAGMVKTVGSAFDLSIGSNTNIVYAIDGVETPYFVQSTGAVKTDGTCTVIG